MLGFKYIVNCYKMYKGKEVRGALIGRGVDVLVNIEFVLWVNIE